MNHIVAWFIRHYPQHCDRMTACSHAAKSGDINPYHIETDCWSHTMMVCKIAEREGAGLAVQIAALLHDIGKPATRQVAANGHVRFFGHEAFSAYLSLQILYAMKAEGLIATEQIPEIFALIALHTLPYTLKEPGHFLTKFRHDRNLFEKLLQLGYCDTTGRFAEKGEVGEDRWVKMRAMAEEMSDDPAGAQPLLVPTLELLVGVSNSGKSTYIERRQKEGFDDVVISRDSLVMTHGGCESYAECWDALDQKTHRKIDRLLDNDFMAAAKAGKNIIVDMTNLSRKNRRRWLEKVPADYFRLATIFLTPIETIRSRNEAQRPQKHIPPNVIDSMARRFEYPLYDEVDRIGCVLAE